MRRAGALVFYYPERSTLDFSMPTWHGNQETPLKEEAKVLQALCLSSFCQRTSTTLLSLPYCTLSMVHCQLAELLISNLVESFVLSGIFLNTMVPGPIKHPEPTNTPGIIPV